MVILCRISRCPSTRIFSGSAPWASDRDLFLYELSLILPGLDDSVKPGVHQLGKELPVARPGGNAQGLPVIARQRNPDVPEVSQIKRDIFTGAFPFCPGHHEEKRFRVQRAQ